MEVSVVVVVYNETACLGQCLTAILNQTFTSFELFVVNDSSTDETSTVIDSFSDERIRSIQNDQNYGIAESRNIGIRHSKGKYIFFTDADCVPVKNWLEEGLKVLEEKKCVGVAGRTFYAEVEPTISDRVVADLTGRYFGTNNIGYCKEILDKVGGFEPRFGSLTFEDIDIALRIKKHGEIIVSEDMIVIHQRERHTIKSLFRYAKRAQNAVFFIKRHKDYRNFDIIWWKIVYPKKLLILMCPFILPFYYSLKSWHDIKLLFFIYLSAFYLRGLIWKMAIKERIFLI